MDSTLLATFRRTCAAYPDRPAIIDSSGVLTFGGLYAQVTRLAAALRAEGLRPGDRVAVSIADERRHLLASLALLRLGCPQATLATHDPPQVRAGLIDKCGLVAVVGDGTAMDPVAAIQPDFEATAHGSAVEFLDMPEDEATAVLFTGSGTTGTFKVIPISHGAFLAQAVTRQVAATSGIEYIPASVEFLYPKKHRLRSAVTGYTSLLQTAEQSEMPELCRRHAVDFLRLAPAQAQSLIDAAASGARLPDGIAVYVGGSRISGGLRAAFQERQVPSLYVEYGATECGNIAVAGPGMHARYPDGVGQPLPGVAIEIVDDDGRVLPAGAEGLIRIRTPGMAQAYLDDEELTARVFRDGWFQGGDRGALTDDGVLVFGGRADDMMILSSINIFPSEIEKVAESFPGVLECAAFPLRSTVHGDIPMLAVVGETNADLTGLMAYCRERLGVRAPRKVIGLAEMPRSPQGKIVRRELSDRAARGEFR
jgi:acyl-coenzyme A synthetase/AMP-(fatty) acid ligase